MRKLGLYGMVLLMTLVMTMPVVAFAGEGFYTEGTPEIESISEKVVSIQVSETDITIDMVGESKFLTVTGILSNGESVDLTDCVDFQSDNVDVVYPYRGRLLARGTGEADVTISYQDLEINVNVTVDKPLTVPDNIPTVASSYVDLSIALGMINCTWTPLKTMKSWVDSADGSYIVYQAGQSYTGVLYTQNDWNTKAEFLSAVAKDDFYVPLPRSGMSSEYTQPKYGNDCSGFVSIVWELGSRYNTKMLRDGIRSGSFTKVGGYNIEDAYAGTDTARTRLMTNLLSAYESLQQGDAVVYRNNADSAGHTFLIYVNDVSSKKVYAYEQTNPSAALTVWNYSDMAKQLYVPFRK